MRAEQADVVIIGAGLAGSAAARALASRGRAVVLLEAFQPGHRRGSSHGTARIFRRAYPDPLYVRLTGQAQVLWHQLADEAGEEFVSNTGAIDYAPDLGLTGAHAYPIEFPITMATKEVQVVVFNCEIGRAHV